MLTGSQCGTDRHAVKHNGQHKAALSHSERLTSHRPGKVRNKEKLEVISAGKMEESRARFRQQRHNYCPLVKG